MGRRYLREGAVFLSIGLVMAALQVPVTEYILAPFLEKGFSVLQLPEEAVLQSSIIEAVLGVLLWILISGDACWKEQVEAVKGSRVYLWISGGLLVAGVASGLFFGRALWFLSQPLIEGITALAEYAGKLTLPHFIVFIFGNNIRVAVTAGIFMALIPLAGFLFSAASAFLNGLVLGSINEATGISFLSVLIGTFPHGILEIPAFVLSLAVGMRANVLIIKGTFGFLFPGKGLSRRKALEEGLKGAIDSMRLFYLIVPMFLAAAVVESVISIWLINAL